MKDDEKLKEDKRLKAEQTGFARAGREGFALVLALAVVAVGAVLSAFLIQMGYSFLVYTARQRNFYGDHVSVMDYVQKVKGGLVFENNARGAAGKPVLRGRGLASADSRVTGLGDLVLPGGAYSFDVVVGPWGMGRQRVNVQVFDVYYFYDQIEPALRNDPAGMKPFPPPVNALAGVSFSMSGVGEDGDFLDPSTGSREKSSGGYRMDNFGAYAVRVRLYDETTGRLMRSAEEAFYQIPKP